MAYKCEICNAVFEDPDYEEVCMEDFYGVGSMFMKKTYKLISCCPKCGSGLIEEYYEEDEDELD